MIIDLFINGKKMNFHNPSDSMAQGIGMVQQHFMLFESMTVAENIVYKRTDAIVSGEHRRHYDAVIL